MDSRARLDRLRGLLLDRASQAAKQAGDTDCVRLCAGLADGLPGILVDQFGPLVVAVDYSGLPEPGPGAAALLPVVRECRLGRPVMVKVRAAADGSNRFSTAAFSPESGMAPLVATELGLKFSCTVNPLKSKRFLSPLTRRTTRRSGVLMRDGKGGEPGGLRIGREKKSA